MKRILGYLAGSFVFVFNLLYLIVVVDCYWREFELDGFVHWGYPQWGWLYQTPEFYALFSRIYIVLLGLMLIGSVVFWLLNKNRITCLMLGLPLLSAFYFVYLPQANHNKQSEIYNAEKVGENSRVPEGKWWVSVANMQRYADVSPWEKLKGLFARGEWPGGYSIWGEYRVWLVPDVMTDALGRRGLVIHGGTQNSSPWGIDMGESVVDFAIRLRENAEPIMLEVNYDLEEVEAEEYAKMTKGESAEESTEIVSAEAVSSDVKADVVVSGENAQSADGGKASNEEKAEVKTEVLTEAKSDVKTNAQADVKAEEPEPLADNVDKKPEIAETEAQGLSEVSANSENKTAFVSQDKAEEPETKKDNLALTEKPTKPQAESLEKAEPKSEPKSDEKVKAKGEEKATVPTTATGKTLPTEAKEEIKPISEIKIAPTAVLHKNEPQTLPTKPSQTPLETAKPQAKL